MNELGEARAELARLEASAKDLLRQLLDVRAAISQQRTKINELIRQRPPAIDRLPTEILLPILIFAIHTQPSFKRKQQLAGVCRRWKNIVLDSPMLWSLIRVSRRESLISIRTHLKRSGNAPLDILIEVKNGSSGVHDILSLTPDIQVVLAHAHRWQSLFVVDRRRKEDDLVLGELISYVTAHTEFPSLKHVIIPDFGDVAYPTFLSPACAPALEHLELADYCPSDDFLPVTTLKKLELTFNYYDLSVPSSFLSRIPTNTLTTLKLKGETSNWLSQTDSIHFPALSILTLMVTHTRRILQAIVAPNLQRFTYDASFESEDVFSGLGPKFRSVRSLHMPCKFFDPPDTVLLCETFPGVRHVELKQWNFMNFFEPCFCTTDPAESPYRIDRWNDLESLSLWEPDAEWTEGLDDLLRWLTHRRKSDLPPLHVKLTGIRVDKPSEAMLDYSLQLYNKLKAYCILEFDVPVKVQPRLAVEADSALWLVSALTPHEISEGFSLALLL